MPRLSHRHWPILVTLGLTAGIASAAPVPRKARPRARARATTRPPVTTTGGCRSTTPPTPAQCLTPGYLDSACGRKFKSTCKPVVEQKLKTEYENNPSPAVKMLRPRKHEMPRDLRDGKVFEYNGPKNKSRLAGSFPAIKTIPGTSVTAAKAGARPTIKPVPGAAKGAKLNGTKATRLATKRPNFKLSKTSKRGGLVAMSSDNIFARTGLTRPPQSGMSILPKNAHRNPAWETNGQKVTSCEEYGYEQVYDWARYTDAVAACSGDFNCQLDIAFLPSTPGIASRTLRRRDGKALKTQIGIAKKASLPKNDMFAFGAKFAYAGGPKGIAKSAELDALAQALSQGEKHYELGCKRGCGGTKFKDEWDFHRQLHDRNRHVSIAEFQEYERRKARFRELVSQWNRAVFEEKERIIGGLPVEVAWVHPIDMVTANPLERFDIMRKGRSLSNAVLRQNRRTKGKFLRGLPGAGAVTKPVVGGQRYGALDLGLPTSVAGVMAYKPGKNTKPSASKSRPGTRGRNAAMTAMCNPKAFGNKVMELAGIGPISCQIGQFLRQEWARKAKGHRSCLDMSNDDCDWSPQMFESRFTKGVPYLAEQNAHEVECVDYTGDNFSTPKANLTATENYIKSMKNAIGTAMKELKPYDQGQGPHGKKFGRAWTDADAFGDKDWFAAGYDYDLGWDVTPVKKKGSNICQLGGGARGGFGVDAWLIKNKYEVVDGLAKADYNRKANKQGKIHAHLRVFKQNVFNPIDASFTGAWSKPLGHGKVQIPKGTKPSFTFMAGPVPITGAVWGEFFYGAEFKAEIVTETNANCDMNDVKIGAKGSFIPQLGLNAKAQIGVGISGLLSAGVRGMLNLITLSVPVTAALHTKIKNISSQPQVMLGFDLDVQLSLATLSGWLAVYLEFLLWEEEWVIFRWNGLGPETISLLGKPLKTELPVFRMK